MKEEPGQKGQIEASDTTPQIEEKGTAQPLESGKEQRKIMKIIALKQEFRRFQEPISISE